MRDISLHLLDLAQNSISAGATLVEFTFTLKENGQLIFVLKDDGCGMDSDFLAEVTSPFTTTRTTRKVGLGIPLMKQNAEATGGTFRIESQKGVGTTMEAVFDTASIDCLPLGDLAGTVSSLVLGNPEKPDFLLVCSSPRGEMNFDTRELRIALEGVPLNEPEIVQWMTDSINEELQPIFGGVLV